MRKLLYIILLGLISQTLSGQSIVFLHHSTGNNIWRQGDVPEWIAAYNLDNGTNYQIEERDYPHTPYTWDNYPYDYWNLWINGACDNSNPNIECLDKLAQDYDVIIFKHCFPGAQILPDDGNPDVTSSAKTFENYKLQYRALLALMDSYTDTKFIVWTQVPNHRLNMSVEQATRCREFVDWVKDTWLLEDGNPHSNIYVFDFFSYAAELDPNPEFGQLNCLKYDYELSHTIGDAHPNLLANQTIGPIFSQFIVNTIEDTPAEDTDPPSVPSGLALESVTSSEVRISWDASTDNIGVSGYRIYRDGSLVGTSSSLTYSDEGVEDCTDYVYTVSAFDAAGNESNPSAGLDVSTCLPDLTPTLTMNPNVANGESSFDLIVRVTELNGVDSQGDIIVCVPKDSHWVLAEEYNSALSELSGTPLDNSGWVHSEDTSNHIFTSSAIITSGSNSTFGFRITFNPNGSSGINPITTQLVSGSGGEYHVSNNSDSEKLDYFQE